MNLLLFFIISVVTLVVVRAQTTSTTTKPDIVFIVPDRSTSYPNGLHNGILTSAYGTNYTVQVVEYGNYDQAKSFKALNDAIDTPADKQPKVYCIWPMDIESKELVGKLHETHNVPIIQINQLPDDWELDHLLGYAGPRDAERAGNAGIMIVDAMKERGIKGKVVALGYPASYGGYSLSINAFRESLDSSIEIVKEAPLARPDLRQSAYLEIVNLIDNNVEFNSVYAMDDDILLGAYEALNDRNRVYVKGQNDGADAVTLVGTVCNGARELLENGEQYGTTIQAPFLESSLAFDQLVDAAGRHR